MSYSFADAVWAAEITGWDKVAGAETTFYIASNARFTVGGVAATIQFTMALLQPANAARWAFGGRTTVGRGTVSVGEVIVDNKEGRLDHLRNYRFDGRSIVLKVGQLGQEYNTDFAVALDMAMQDAVFGQETIRFPIRDWQRVANAPLQTNVYAGDNVAPDGLEGTSDLKDKAKPVCLGAPRNVEPVLVNPQKNIWQVNDGAIQSVPVRDSGLELLGGFGEYASTDTFGANAVNAMCFGAGLLVAVGNAGTLKTSPDGVTWTARTSQFGASGILAVAYDATLGFVAVGIGGKISTSSDALTWAARTSGVGTDLFCVSFHNSLMVVGGASSTLITSPTGVTWTARTVSLSVASRIQALSSSGSFIIAGTDLPSEGLWVSSNATIWSLIPNTHFRSGILALVFTGSVFVAGDGEGVLATSLDNTGSVWTKRDSPFFPSGFGSVFALAVGVGLVVAVGVDNSNSPAVAYSKDDGVTWTQGHTGFGAVAVLAVAYGADAFAIGAISGGIRTTLASDEYANAADLEDDTKAPAPGCVKPYLAGGYVRLGSPASGRITCDPVQGAAVADRTAAQLSVQVLGRAGFVGGDWSASDVTALDAANGAALEYYTTTGDQVMCADVIDRFMRSVGAWWAGDKTGVIRMKRLDDPAPNKLSLPSSLATAPWVAVASASATNAFASHDGISLARVQGNGSTGQLYQPVTLVGNTRKVLTFKVYHKGVTGRDVHQLFDETSGVALADVRSTFNADGTITFSLTTGTSLKTARLKQGTYHVRVVSTTATASHTHRVYASKVATLGSGGVTDSLSGDWEAFDAEPAIYIEQTQMNGMEQVQSSDQNGGIPRYRTVLRYSKNYTPLTGTDLAGDVSDSDRVLLSKEWLDTGTTADTAVQAAHPLSEQAIEETSFTTLADADTEKARRQALHGADRFWFDVPVFQSDTVHAIEMGDVIELASTRYNLGAGKRFAGLGIEPNAESGLVTFAAWGKLN